MSVPHDLLSRLTSAPCFPACRTGADLTHDGKISFDEFRLMMQQQMVRHVAAPRTPRPAALPLHPAPAAL